MGLHIGFSSSCSSYDIKKPKLQDCNPNPNRYNIRKSLVIGKYLIIRIEYPDCKNFEGEKILVYHNIDLKDLLAQKAIDPHFSESTKFYSPIARFIPTSVGWEMAIKLCKLL